MPTSIAARERPAARTRFRSKSEGSWRANRRTSRCLPTIFCTSRTARAGAVLRHLWKIVVFVATCVAATFVISSRLTPIYEASAVIDVDRQAPSAIIGQDSNRAAGPNDSDQFLATQVKLIQSDAVLRSVAQKYN